MWINNFISWADGYSTCENLEDAMTLNLKHCIAYCTEHTVVLGLNMRMHYCTSKSLIQMFYSLTFCVIDKLS